MARSQDEDSLRRQYAIKDIIGQGSTSCVILAEHRFSGMLVAIKVLKNVEDNLRYIFSEVEIMEGLRHSNIIRVFQIIATARHVHIVMEYAEGGDLRHRIEQAGRLQEDEARRLFHQMVNAMHYCHQRGIVHRDLKTHNILVDSEGNAKVSDFGLATKCHPGNLLQRRCGTYPFSAPELFCPGPYDGRKVDVWSMGVLLYNILTADYPFKGQSFTELKEQICQGTFQIPDYVSTDVQDLIGKLLTFDAVERPTLDEIIKHPWLSQGEELSATGPSETDLNHPDPSLLTVLSLMGYDLDKIRESLQKREYDEYMGTYLMLEQQAEEHRYEVPEMHLNTVLAPCPTPYDQYLTRIPINRTVSLPFLNLITSSLTHHEPKEETPAKQKACRSASLPNIALGFPRNETTTPSPAKQSGAIAVPKESSKPLSIKMPLPTRPPPKVTAARPPNTITRWKRVGRRMRACLSRLCCCLARPKIQP